MTGGRPAPKMNMPRETCFITIFVSFLIMLLYPCVSSIAQEADQSVDGFNLVQYEEGGEKKWELNGKSAKVEGEKVKIDEISALAFGEETTLKLKAKKGSFDRENGLVHLDENVVIKTTDRTTITTDSLNWDAKTKNVFTDESVNMKRAEFEVKGSGAEIDLENKKAELKNDITANIASPETGILGTGKTSKDRTTEITCEGPLELNYKKNRAAFLNNVEIKDKEGNIFADRIDVYFNPSTRRIKCVVARGNVRIINGENITYSERAIYLVDEGRVVLPKRPKLVIKTGSQ